MTSALKVDVDNEFSSVLSEASLLARSLIVVETRDPEEEAIAWVLSAGMAAAIEKIYSGCERIMQMLAKGVDGEAVDHADGWHGALLKRMANPFPDVRGPILSKECTMGWTASGPFVTEYETRTAAASTRALFRNERENSPPCWRTSTQR